MTREYKRKSCYNESKETKKESEIQKVKMKEAFGRTLQIVDQVSESEKTMKVIKSYKGKWNTR